MKRGAHCIFLFLIFLSSVQASDFSVSSPVIKTVSEGHEKIDNELSVLNFGQGQIFNISSFSKENFIFLDKLSFYLDQEGSDSFVVTLDGENLNEGVYVGKVIVKSATEEQVIPVVLEIQTPFPLFDVSLESDGIILVNNRQELNVNVKIYKLKGQNNEVNLNYFLKNTEGEIIFSETQAIFVDGQTEIKKIIDITNASSGDLIFYVEAVDSNKVSTGTSSFIFSNVLILQSPENQSESDNVIFLIFVFIILFLIIAFLIFNYYWNRKTMRGAQEWKKKLSDVKKTKFSDAAQQIRKLEPQKQLLESAFKKKYITKESYEEGLKKTNDLINKLKKRL